MQKWILIGVWCCLASWPVAQANEVLENAVAVYARERAGIEDTFRAERLALPRRHLAILRNMEAYYQQEADLAALQAVQQAQQKFVLDPTPAGLVELSSPAPLVRLQQGYRRAFAAAAERRSRRLEALESQYRSSLLRLQADLIREGQMEDVRAVAAALAELQGGGADAAVHAVPAQGIDPGRDSEPATASETPVGRPGVLRPEAPVPDPSRSSESNQEDSFGALLDTWFD